MATSERKAGMGLAWAVAAGAGVRAACFPFSVDSGDAPGRIALAVRWLHEPSLMTAKDCSGYGPLSILLNAFALWIWDAPYTSPRLLALIFGVASIIPLAAVTRLLFGDRAALFCASFATFYTLGVKYSGMAYAEAPFMFLFFSCVYFLFRFRQNGRTPDLVLAALLLTIACMVRYEGYLYIPILGACAIRSTGNGQRWFRPSLPSLKPALGFVVLASVLPLLWMAFNYAKLGDPLWNWRFTAEYLKQVAAEATTLRGEAWSFLYRLLFAPGVLLLSLTPAIAILSGVGLLKTLARKQTLTYAALLIPSALYVVQLIAGELVSNARFLTLTGALLLPYAGAQMDAWLSVISPTASRQRIIAVFLSAAAVFVSLVAIAHAPRIPFHQKFWSVAPVSPLLPEERAVCDLLRARMRPGDQIVQNGYTDFTHIITFHISPNIYENWWGRPAIEDLKTPEERRRYLESSAPGYAVFETRHVNLAQLLAVPEERLSDFSSIIIKRIYTSPKYTVYELIPKGTRTP